VRAPGSATGTDRSRTGPQKAVDGWPVVEQGYRGWGVWFPDDPQRTPWHRFLDEAAAAGYTAVELGPYGYLPTHPEQLRAELGRRVAGVEVPGQRLGQRRNLDPHPALGQLRQRPRIPFPVDQRGQHRPHGDGGQARGDDRQLDGSVLEHQLQPHRLPGAVAHQLLPIAGQHPQPAIVCRRHERRAQQPVLEQLGDPLGIFHVGLAAGHGLHVRAVGQPDLQHLLQAVERRLPVGRGRLHRRDRHALGQQPVPHHYQRARRGLDRPRLAHPTTTRPRRAHADAQRLLADVQPGDPLEQDLHLDRLPRQRVDAVRRDLCQDTDPRALRQQSSGTRGPHAIHLKGLAPHQ
jgi:hypothetical protein